MQDRPAVVLVHGMWMNRYACAPLALGLRQRGFAPHLFGYPTLNCDLATSAARLSTFVAGLGVNAVHFVGHSLGGLIVLRALMDHAPAGAGRIVLLGSPVQGSGVANSLIRQPGGKLLLGVSLMDWNASPLDSWSGTTEIGAIAGSLRFGLGTFFSQHLPAPNDGAVAVEETRLPGMKAHIVLPVSHTGMLLSTRVMSETATFLKTGDFSRAT
jgi:pimeloyl-ACP methyl ester carboxylesterase